MIKHFDNQDHCNYLMLTFMLNATVAALEMRDSNYLPGPLVSFLERIHMYLEKYKDELDLNLFDYTPK